MRFCSLAVLSSLMILGATGCDGPKKAPEQVDFGSASLIPHALVGNIYFLPIATRRLPDFSTLKPVGTIYAPALNVPERNWQKGFPGITDRFEWFGIAYRGRLHANAAGHYKFRVVSDDGSKIFLDDKLVLDNDGLHPVRSVAHDVNLDDSWHDLRIEYMQGPRYSVALQVFCAAPGGKEQIFPACNIVLDSPVGSGRWWLWLLLLLLLIAIIAEEIWRRRRKRQPPQPS